MSWRALSVAMGAVLLLAVCLAFAAPALAARGHAEAVALYLAFEPFCHQNADRCWRVNGLSAALCVRCSGALLGAALALFAKAPFSLRALGVAAGVTALTWSIDSSGAASVPEGVRFASGLGLGGALAAVMTIRSDVERTSVD